MRMSSTSRLTLALATACLAVLAFGGVARAAAPTATSGTATNIQGTSALLRGEVAPGGQSTTYRFEYTTQSSFSTSGFSGATSTASEPAGSGGAARDVSAAVSGLAPSTTYRFRLVASNAAGSSQGAAAEFTTTAGFGFRPGEEGFSASIVDEGGADATEAGSHPYQLTYSFGFRQGGAFEGEEGVPFTDGDLRNLTLDLPAGMIENPNALPKCSAADFHTPRSSPFEVSLAGESCPQTSQIGVVRVDSSLGGGATRTFGLFNLAAPPGIPSRIGFAPFGEHVVFDSALRTDAGGAYALALRASDFPQRLNVSSFAMTVWGTPWGVSHNGERGDCLNEGEPDFPWAKCSVGPPTGFKPLAYLTLPTTCEGPLSFSARANSWQQPATVTAQANGPALGACEGLIFDPHPFARLTDKKASSSSGLNFQLSANNEALILPDFRIPSQAKKVVVTMPEGVNVNPSVGAGLGVCTPSAYAAETAFNGQGAGCPNSSKIGEFDVTTPLFGERFEGAIYLAEPDDPSSSAHGAQNPFDTLLAIYMIAKSPQRGILIKVAGRLDLNPGTGAITATFDDLPALPYSSLEANFRAGQRAPLVTPPFCGTHYSKITMVPWVGPAQTAHATSESHIEAGIDNGPCPSGSVPPFNPDAVAGGVNSNVGSYTPYFVHLTRKDTEQEITSYSLKLPRGITGKLAGIPFCSEAEIAAAKTRRGVEEATNPSCPAASQVGRTLTGYGVGKALTYAEGRVYMAGPYHGQPLSLVTINPATVGPFDLGTVVIRSAFSVDERTAQLAIDSEGSDPIPHILGGVPLRLRDIRVYMDRPEFTRNPTSCEPSELTSTLTGSGANFEDPGDDSSATIGVHFQLLNCGTLGYSPKLGLKLRGGTRRNTYPSLQAVVQGRPGDANLKRFVVTMPHSLFLAQNHIRSICTRVQFAENACPPSSVYGHAVAFTPLLDEPLRGSVYLRSSDNKLPDLVTSLYSGSIHIVIDGRIGPAHRGIRATFEDLPDAPLTRFVMKLRGGKHGLLVNSADICAQPPAATVKAIGQNSRGAEFRSVLRSVSCKKRRKHRKRHNKHRRKHGGKRGKGKQRRAAVASAVERGRGR
jgi:hypothetical protein